MKILNINSFEGRNIYSHKPVIVMDIDVGDFYKKPTKEYFGFNEGLLKLFPGLSKHSCSTGHEGGFLERLEEGTYIPHVLEHTILELQNMLSYKVNYGKTRVIEEPSIYRLVYQCENQRCAVECGIAAINIFKAILSGEKIEFEKILNKLRQISVQCELGPSTKAIMDEAIKRNIPITRLGENSMLQLGYGKNLKYIEASITDTPSCISVDMAGNKHLTKQILSSFRIPVPHGDIAFSVENAERIAENIGYPVAIKPLDANQGKGVTLFIRNRSEVDSAFSEAIKHSNTVVVERHIWGRDYRALVVGDKVCAVSERRPPFVTGDGHSTVQMLLEKENRSSLRGQNHEKPLTIIRMDAGVLTALHAQGIDEKYIPQEGEQVYLRFNGNLSTGGTARDCTLEIHPENVEFAVCAAKALGLDIAGVDFKTCDISKPITKTGGAIIEVNAAPGLRMHLYPTEGSSRNVAADILDYLYPDGSNASIPIVSITGTNGKTTTTRLIGHVLSASGKKVGMTTTSGVYIDGNCFMKGDNTGPVSARLILSNKSVEAAVLETARGGILRKGLGYDLADVAVLTNISDDHLGIDGIESMEDLAFVKALPIEAVKPEGSVVLNADDPMCSYLMSRVKSGVMLFSKDESNPLIQQQIRSGSNVAYLKDGMLCIHNNHCIIPVLEVDEIPITYNGIVECNIENSLAALGALYLLGVGLQHIRLGLKTFLPDTVTNPGRFNIFDLGYCKVMLDYSHNIAGYREVVKSIKKMEASRFVGVIGMPGDRKNENIIQVGELCGRYFDKLYIKEDSDLRGREPGEVAGILFDAVIKSGIANESIEIVYDEARALDNAITSASEGDLIVMLYEDFEQALEVVNMHMQKSEVQKLESSKRSSAG